MSKALYMTQSTAKPQHPDKVVSLAVEECDPDVTSVKPSAL